MSSQEEIDSTKELKEYDYGRIEIKRDFWKDLVRNIWVNEQGWDEKLVYQQFSLIEKERDNVKSMEKNGVYTNEFEWKYKLDCIKENIKAKQIIAKNEKKKMRKLTTKERSQEQSLLTLTTTMKTSNYNRCYVKQT